jgi:tetratricopeptide (TPR) repeat protein
MFEVITQSQASDYQSLEILKEAYIKLGREQDVMNTAKRIAQAYVHLGQLSSAILEYESILQKYPEDADAQAALAEIESKANSFAAPASSVDTDLMKAAASTSHVSDQAPTDGKAISWADIDDGRAAMQKLYIDSKLLSVGDFDLYWPKPPLDKPPAMVIEPFLQVLADKQVLQFDKSIKHLLEKSRAGYIPIEKYDVDIEFARTFPKDLCQRWAVLPFDRMSKATLVATANPFNKHAAREIESISRNRVLFYVANPPELVKILKKVFR